MKNDLQKDEIKISVASPDDAAELLEILAYYVRETAIPYDNEVPTIDRFRQRIENTLEKYPFLEARRGGVEYSDMCTLPNSANASVMRAA